MSRLTVRLKWIGFACTFRPDTNSPTFKCIETLGDSESIEPMQNLAVDVTTPAELETGIESRLSEEQNLEENGPVAPGTPCEEISDMNDGVNPSDQPLEGHRFVGSRSIACQSPSSCRETNGVHIPRLDRDKCPEPPAHVNLEATVLHNEEVTPCEDAEIAASPCYSIHKSLDSDTNQPITSPPKHAQSINGQMSAPPTSHSPSPHPTADETNRIFACGNTKLTGARPKQRTRSHVHVSSITKTGFADLVFHHLNHHICTPSTDLRHQTERFRVTIANASRIASLWFPNI